VVLGSGLSAIASRLVGGDPTAYTVIEGMPHSGAAGHQGALYSGEVDGVPTLVFAGRVHLYEGYDAKAVTHAVRLAVGAGCRTVVLTNAAGGLNQQLDIGAPCLISDHINLTGENPLVGEATFLDLTNVYDAELRQLARSLDPSLKEGVYAGLLGPTYETPAEVRMLSILGADLVGMSTVLEAIAARALGARVLGISVVTNLAAGLSDRPLHHEEVAEAGRRAGGRVEALLRAILPKL
jgi:purine-nucleoside phosphorylase